MALEELQRVDVDSTDPRVRGLYTQAIAIALVGNVVLLLAKAIGAWLTQSSAIYADAANSASDVAYSVLMAVALRLSLRPPDVSHPHGHRRIESLVSMLIGVMMTVAALEAARSAISAWRSGPEPITSAWAYVVLSLSVFIKALMYYSVRRIAQAAGSPALMASARDNLSDVLSSVMAAAGVVGSRFVSVAADPVAGLLLSLWILQSAWAVLQESIRELIGGAPSRELSERVVAAVRAIPGVLGVHRVIIEYVGPKVRVDIHVNMRRYIGLEEVHRLSHAVREAVEALEEVDHAFVHVEPPQPDNGPPTSDPSPEKCVDRG